MKIIIDDNTAHYYLVRAGAMGYQVLITEEDLNDNEDGITRINSVRAAAATNGGMAVMVNGEGATPFVHVTA